MANEHIREATKKVRLIDANALMEEVKRCFAPPNTLPTVFSALSGIVKNAPTVDAVEVVHGRCDWCKTGEEKCGTCRMFFDYYGDGGSDKCSSECDSGKCAYYQPIGFCPNCGAKMDGDGNG